VENADIEVENYQPMVEVSAEGKQPQQLTASKDRRGNSDGLMQTALLLFWKAVLYDFQPVPLLKRNPASPSTAILFCKPHRR